MAHIEKPRRCKDGSWSARVRYRIGGRDSKLLAESFSGYASEKECLKAAQHRANDFERQKYLGELTGLDAGCDMTCGELVEDYFRLHVNQELAGCSPDYYTRAIPIYFTPFFGHKRVYEVNRRDAREWKAWLAKEARERSTLDEGGRAGSATVAKMIQIGRGIFTFAVETERRPDNPLDLLKAPKVRQSARKRKYAPTPLQVEAIRAVISQEREGTAYAWVRARDRLLVSLEAYEGLRQQEVYPACWWQLIDESGNVRTYLIVDGQKTDAADRDIELWRQVREEIAFYYELMGRPPLGSLAFPGIRGAQLTTRNWSKRVWRPALAEARKLPGFKTMPHFGPHRLRAACATMLGYALTPQHVVLDFLGHRQWTTTMRFYLVAFKEQKKAKKLQGLPVEDQIDQAREELAARMAAPADWRDAEAA